MEEGGERGRMWEVEGEEWFQGCTLPVAEQWKCTVMHYLARPVLVFFFIKKHGWLNTAAFTKKSRESCSLNDTATSLKQEPRQELPATYL